MNRLTIKDVIRIARDLLKNETLIVPRQTVIDECAIPVDRVSEKCLDSIDPGLRSQLQLVDVFGGLLPIVQKAYGHPIEILEVEADGAVLYGDVKDYGTHAKIRFLKGITPCWVRFTIAKELLHLYTDTTTIKGETPEHLFASAKHARDKILTDSTPLDDEQVAFYLAVELFLPFKLRRTLLTPLWDHFGEENAYPVAKAFMCPRAVIEQVRDDRYLDLSYRINSEVEKE